MKKIIFTDEEMETIREKGETCLFVAEEAMKRSGYNFDDIERINDYYEDHKWGSNTDRAYRKRAIKKAILKVASNPLKYI